MKTVKESFSRPSVIHRIATDWIIGRYLKWCLMYSRDLYNIKIKYFILLQGFLSILLLIYDLIVGLEST